MISSTLAVALEARHGDVSAAYDCALQLSHWNRMSRRVPDHR